MGATTSLFVLIGVAVLCYACGALMKHRMDQEEQREAAAAVRNGEAVVEAMRFDPVTPPWQEGAPREEYLPEAVPVNSDQANVQLAHVIR